MKRSAASAPSSTPCTNWVGGYRLIVLSTRSASLPNSALTISLSFACVARHSSSAFSGAVPWGSKSRMSWSEAPPVSGSLYFLPEIHEPSPTTSLLFEATSFFSTFCTRTLVGSWPWHDRAIRPRARALNTLLYNFIGYLDCRHLPSRDTYTARGDGSDHPQHTHSKPTS